jgi:Flp pilus assembly protein TadB
LAKIQEGESTNPNPLGRPEMISASQSNIKQWQRGLHHSYGRFIAATSSATILAVATAYYLGHLWIAVIISLISIGVISLGVERLVFRRVSPLLLAADRMCAGERRKGSELSDT